MGREGILGRDQQEQNTEMSALVCSGFFKSSGCVGPQAEVGKQPALKQERHRYPLRV